MDFSTQHLSWSVWAAGEPGLLSKLLQGICQELLRRSNDSLKLKCSQGDAGIASDAKHTLACIKELLHSLADCMDHAVLREELQTQVGRPLLEEWGAEAKQLPEGVEMITQLMNSMEVSVSNLGTSSYSSRSSSDSNLCTLCSQPIVWSLPGSGHLRCLCTSSLCIGHQIHT